MSFDKELELRDLSDGAETSTVNEAGIALDVRHNDYFKVVLNVTALDTSDADETYDLVVDVDSASDFADTPAEVGRITITATGEYIIPLHGEFITQEDADAAAIRVGCELGGTTPSITYGAYVAP